jgi:hypothetical protein
MHIAGKEFRQTAELKLATVENLDQSQKSESARGYSRYGRDVLERAGPMPCCAVAVACSWIGCH